MNVLKSLDINAMKRRAVVIPVVAVIVLAALWWFFWMAPQGSKLTSINAQITRENSQLAADQATLAVMQHEQAIVRANAAYLARFSGAVPPAPDQQILTTQVYDLAQQTGVHLPSFSDNTATGGTAKTVGTIPVAISITGSHTNCLKFLQQLYQMPRLITISSFTPSPLASSSTGTGAASVLTAGSTPYTFVIAAQAYYFSGTTTPAGTGASG